MRKLLIYLKDYKKESILGPLFKLLEASFELLVPLVMAMIIDRGIATADKPFVLRMGLLLFGLGVVGLLCSLTAQFFAAKAAVGFTASVRSVLFKHIMNFSYTQMDRLGSSSLITRMTSDMNQVQSGVNLVLRLFLRSPFIVFGAMIMAFAVDVRAALIFAVTIPLLAIVVFGIMLIGIPIYHKVQGRLDGLTRNTRESLSGVRVIRAFRLEKQWIIHFAENNKALCKVQMVAGRVSAVMNPVTYIIINVALVLLIYVGGVRVNIGNLTQGEVVALTNYMSQILVELIKLANLIITTTKAVACGNRIQDILDIEEEQEIIKPILTDKLSTGKDSHYISFENVTCVYNGAPEPAVEKISFHVDKGQTIGIIGGTGSGKSTLIHLLAGFYHPTEGKIFLDGEELKDISGEELYKKIHIVPQKSVLFRGTIADNLKWGQENATEEEMWKALKTAQAEDFVLDKEGKLNAQVSQAGKNFSGGQRQRLTIARAVIGNPEILILDDSTSALDYKTDASLRKAIRELQYHPTVFLISQRTNSIQYADQILVLDDGQLVGMGTHEELLKSCDVYQEIYQSQFKKSVQA